MCYNTSLSQARTQKQMMQRALQRLLGRILISNPNSVQIRFGYHISTKITRTNVLAAHLFSSNSSPGRHDLFGVEDLLLHVDCNLLYAREALGRDGNALHQPWLNLHSSFASASRGHVLALKSKLGKNPRGNRSINDYLHDMQSISNELALNQNPVKDEDLVAHVLNQLGSEYDPISSAAFIRDSALSFPELGDILRDFERKLQVSDTAVSSMVATANSTQRHSVSNSRFNGGHSSTAPIAYPRRGQQHLGSGRQTRRQDGAHSSCQFCSIPGHDIKGWTWSWYGIGTGGSATGTGDEDGDRYGEPDTEPPATSLVPVVGPRYHLQRQ
ncbi:hypothetical protein DM860_004143 [Cuscuta australis]|uniref:Uncharacterized protein n=1 Tax=Cuscuta australis TaxID=267555 RepID=A0A328CY37_9ASTE|nr:hypothetical protein DM860_004143 [Cuscuta australis]